MPKLLFLSANFTGYFHQCLQKLVKNHGFEVQIIRWGSSANTLFQFVDFEGISIHLKTKFSQADLLEKCLDFQPDMVYFPGWMDKDYLKIASQLRSKGTISIMGFDNQWRGTLKQRLLALMGYQFFKRYFQADYVWVAGAYQYEYVRRIGVPKTQILLGLYSANQPAFNAEYQRVIVSKINDYPKRFLYVGRFETMKNPLILYRVFRKIVDEDLHKGWSLTMIGAGEESIHLKTSQHIEIKDFIQPDELSREFSKFGCFVLPSSHEPWGVVIHEAVSAGLPLILSAGTGAETLFFQEGQNGFSFESGNGETLRKTLLQIINSSHENLLKMAERSSELSFQITPDLWASTLKSVL